MLIKYPLYLVPLEAGYVSVIESSDDDSQTYYLAVFTTETLAEEFMQECGIEGAPRPLHNGREFAWLAQSLRAPITSLAFDPQADSKKADARWKVTVDELLKNHIVIDYSPWHYPVYVVEQAGGYASVEGMTSEGDELRAIGLFTSSEKADQFLQDAGEDGVVLPLDGVAQTREFLQSADAAAVALDMTVSDGQRSAKYCFSIKTVLASYLLELDGEPE